VIKLAERESALLKPGFSQKKPKKPKNQKHPKKQKTRKKQTSKKRTSKQNKTKQAFLKIDQFQCQVASLPLQNPHKGVLGRYFVLSRRLSTHYDLEKLELALKLCVHLVCMVRHSHQPQFRCSLATRGWWLPCWTVRVQNVSRIAGEG